VGFGATAYRTPPTTCAVMAHSGSTSGAAVACWEALRAPARVFGTSKPAKITAEQASMIVKRRALMVDPLPSGAGRHIVAADAFSKRV
jgi:hypothetical protein